MRQKISYLITFTILLFIEIAIALNGSGVLRSYFGDILVIPTVYFLLRVFFTRDGIFSVYVLPFICYSMGWIAEVLQALNITEILDIRKDSPLGIIFGSVFDIKDGVAYLFGLYTIGILLAVESKWKDDRRWWYPLGVFIHWTWGHMQTLAGFFIYLWYIRCPHRYYRGVVRVAWPLNSGLSMGMFIFTPWEKNDEERQKYCDKVAIHEYGHTFQALLLGPLYPFIIGIPSLSWGNIPYFKKLRNEKKISYTWLFCEKWASYWGEKVTKEEAIWD